MVVLNCFEADVVFFGFVFFGLDVVAKWFGEVWICQKATCSPNQHGTPKRFPTEEESSKNSSSHEDISARASFAGESHHPGAHEQERAGEHVERL